MIEKEEGVKISQKEHSVGAVIYSIQNERVYVGLVREHSEYWVLPRVSVDLSTSISSQKEKICERVKDILSVKLSIKKTLGEYEHEISAEKNKEIVSYYLAETGHTPLYLVNKDEFDEVKWFLLDEIKSLKLYDGVLPIIEKGVSSIPSERSPYTKVGTIFLGVVAIAIIGYIGGTRMMTVSQNKAAQKKDIDSYNAFYSGILKNDPVPLQTAFLEDVKNGVNDKYTKSDAYFVTHRFFDNGGNIYEIYNYINSHPELAFLNKEATVFFPKTFESIKNKTLPPTFTDTSYYAYLAYVEVLYNHGYTDVAAVSTLANQYAKMAYYNVTIAKEMNAKEGKERSKFAKRDALKAGKFLQIAQSDVADILKGKMTSNDVTPRDILVGLNQYAAATRYLEALLVAVNMPASTLPDSFKNSREVFAFTTEYAHKNVPELILFTSLLNASTLAILASSTPQEIRVALFPILDFNVNGKKVSQTSIIYKIINSKMEPKPKNIGDSNMDIYSKRNTLRLAKKVPEFKSWLMYNGWKESDFK